MIPYIQPGRSISTNGVDDMNRLTGGLDSILCALFSYKSPLAFGSRLTSDWARELLGLSFWFGNPANRRVAAWSARAYDHSVFSNAAAAATIISTSEDQPIAEVENPSVADYDAAGEMFGVLNLANTASLANSWLFDYSLEPHYIVSDDRKLWLKRSFPGSKLIQPREQLHDQAVAEIIFAGMDPGVFVWPAELSKFGCLRFHNLDRRSIQVQFGGGLGSIDIPALGCKAVRLIGAENGRRTSIDSTFTYLWAFRHGDHPVLDAVRNRDAGVWGCRGYSNLASLTIFHEWLDRWQTITDGATGAVAGISSDPRGAWSGGAIYADTFSDIEPEAVLAKFGIQKGTYRSLKKLPDDSWQTSDERAEWIGNLLWSPDLSFTPDGSTLTIATKHPGTHDVLPLTCGFLGELPLAISDTPRTFTLSSGQAVRSRLVAVESTLRGRYSVLNPDIGALESVPVETPIILTQEESTAFNVTTPFTQSIVEFSNFTVTGETSPDSDQTTFGVRAFVFDGLELRMGWETTDAVDYGYRVGAGPGTFFLSDESVTLRFGARLMTAAGDYRLQTGRLMRGIEDGIGFKNGDDWVFTESPDLSDGQLVDAAPYSFSEPSPSESDVSIHAGAGSGSATRTLPVWPIGTNLPRALEEAKDAERWADEREAILSGDITIEDKRKIWRIRGAVEHYNHIASRINVITAVSPLQLTQVEYWGEPFAAGISAVPGTSLVPRGFYAVVDESRVPGLTAMALEFGLAVHDTTEIASLTQFIIPLSGDPERTELERVNRILYGVNIPGYPALRWITAEQIESVARNLEVPFTLERLSIPYAIEMGDDGRPEIIGDGIQRYPVAWASNGDGDWMQLVNPPQTFAMSVWRQPTAPRPSDGNPEDYRLSKFEPAAAGQTGVECPHDQVRALLIERRSYYPHVEGWQSESRSRLWVRPAPMLRYEGENVAGEITRVPIVAEEQPPITARLLSLDGIEDVSEDGVLDVARLKDAYYIAAKTPQQDWGSRTMLYVALLQHSARFAS